MPTARVNGLSLFYEDVGEGIPLIFVHEFAGEARSWHLQVRFFARRYRTIAFNARGFPPSDVPEDPKAYSQDLAVEDIRGMLDALDIKKAHICGLSMGGYATLHFGLRFPERALSLVVASGLRQRRRRAGALQARRRGDGAALRAGRHEGGRRVLHQGPDAGAVLGQGSDGLAGILRDVLPAIRQGSRAHDARRPDDAAVRLRARGRDGAPDRADPHRHGRRGRAL